VLIVIMILTIVLLPISPLPWYDEVDFASITRSFALTGKLICAANDLYFTQPHTEVLYYGPVYFVLQSFIVKAFGFGMLQMRWLNFVAGIACLPLFFQLYRRLLNRRLDNSARLFFAVLMLADYTYFQDMHSARMDLVALCFLLSGLVVVDSHSKASRFAVSGLLIGLGLLCTPRVFSLSIPYYLFLLWSMLHERRSIRVLNILVSVIVCVAVYATWIFIKFGSLTAFVAYVRQPTGVFASGAGDFFTPLYPLAWYQLLVLIAVLVLSIGNWLVADSRERAALLILTGTAVLFGFMSGGSLIYFSIVVGFLYLAATIVNAAVPRLILPAIAIFNFLFLLFKAGVLLTDFESRDPRAFQQWISARLTSGDRVVGDDRFYYASIASGAEFQYSMRGGNPSDRITYQRDRWKADYLLVHDTTDDNFKAYKRAVKLTAVDRYLSRGRESSMLSNYKTGYQCFLFRFAR
jgi:Dolichyl-phosphate-mannose-protein mannosyltransferase